MHDFKIPSNSAGTHWIFFGLYFVETGTFAHNCVTKYWYLVYGRLRKWLGQLIKITQIWPILCQNIQFRANFLKCRSLYLSCPSTKSQYELMKMCEKLSILTFVSLKKIHTVLAELWGNSKPCTISRDFIRSAGVYVQKTKKKKTVVGLLIKNGWSNRAKNLVAFFWDLCAAFHYLVHLLLTKSATCNPPRHFQKSR